MGVIEIDGKSFKDAAKRLTALGDSLDDSIREGTRLIEPEWKRLISANAKTTLERRIIGDNARATATTTGVRLESSGGRVRNGLNATDHGGAVEFGVRRGKRTTYRRKSPKGRTHKVTRVTTNQLRPFRKSGYVFTPAVKAIVPKLAKAWTDAIAEDIKDAIAG